MFRIFSPFSFFLSLVIVLSDVIWSMRSYNMHAQGTSPLGFSCQTADRERGQAVLLLLDSAVRLLMAVIDKQS